MSGRRTIAGLVVREFAAPFAITYALLVVGLGLRLLMLYSEIATRHNVAIGSLLFLELVPITFRALPFACMVAVVVGFGRLIADREVLALATAGVSPLSLLRPVLGAAFAVTGLALVLSCLVLPWAGRSLDDRIDVLSERLPLIAMQPGRPLIAGRWIIDALSVSPDGASAQGVVVHCPKESTTFFARSIELVRADDTTVELVLHDVATMLDARLGPRSVRVDRVRLLVEMALLHAPRSFETRLRGASTGTLWSRVRADRAHVAEALELHGRFAQPALIPILCLIAFAFVLRIGGAANVVSGIAVLTVLGATYVLFLLGDGLARSHRLSPALGAWLSPIVLAAIASVGVASLRRFSPMPIARVAEPPRVRAPRPTSSVTTRSSSGWLLGRYVIRRVSGILVISLPVALVIQLAVDVLEDVAWFSAYQPSAQSLFGYYGARIPMLLVRVAPIAMMVATAVALGAMARDGEILGLSASGVSRAGVLAPVALLAMVASGVQWVVLDAVVSRSIPITSDFRTQIIHGDEPWPEGPPPTYFRRGHDFYVASNFDSDLGRAAPLSVQTIDEQGRPVRRLDADSATREDSGEWTLAGAAAASLESGAPRAIDAPASIDLPDRAWHIADPRRLSSWGLRGEIAATESAGFDARWLHVELWSRLGGLFAMFLLPVIAALVVLQGPPHPPLSLVLALSAGMLALHVVATGIFLALSAGGRVAAPFAAFGPALPLVVCFGALALQQYVAGRGGLRTTLRELASASGLGSDGRLDS